MTIQEIFELALDMGMDADPRGRAFVERQLAKLKKEYEELPVKKKRFFDQESLVNPYADTRFLVGDPKAKVKKILAGIDADATEVILADRLNQKGAKIDLVIGHHPDAHSLAGLHEVMGLQVDVYAKAGVPVNVVHALMNERMKEVELGIHPMNHTQIADVARLLNFPLLILHTVWDNLGNKFMEDYLAKKEFDTVGEIVDYLLELPEYQEAAKGKAGPLVVSGNEKSRVGKIALCFTGGTNPSKEVYVELAKAGVGTVIDMHMKTDAIKEMRKHHVNVINAGHMSSDSIGANIFLDELEARGVEVVACSGLIRVKRKRVVGNRGN